MTFAEVLHYKNIDVESWSWGDVRKTSPRENLADVIARMEKHPGKYGIIVGPPTGSPSYEGHHGLIVAGDAVYAAGFVTEYTNIITLLDEADDWQESVNELIDHGAFLIASSMPQPDRKDTVLPHGALDVVQGRPPQVILNEGEFSEKGLCRLAASMKNSMVRAFLDGLGHRNKDRMFASAHTDEGFEIVSQGFIDGWWDAYPSIDGFAAWNLAKVKITYSPVPGYTAIDDEISFMRDCGRIWGHVIEENSLNVSSRDEKWYVSPDDMKKMRDEFGIASMIEARREGVPTEDILV